MRAVTWVVMTIRPLLHPLPPSLSRLAHPNTTRPAAAAVEPLLLPSTADGASGLERARKGREEGGRGRWLTRVQWSAV